MEEIRDVIGRLVSVIEPEKDICEYTGTGKIRIRIQSVPGCVICIEKKDTATTIECLSHQRFKVNSYLINK